jgi:hypothetical protein
MKENGDLLIKVEEAQELSMQHQATIAESKSRVEDLEKENELKKSENLNWVDVNNTLEQKNKKMCLGITKLVKLEEDHKKELNKQTDALYKESEAFHNEMFRIASTNSLG